MICIEKMDSKESKRLGRAIDWNSLIYIRCDADEQFEWVVKDMIKELSE